MKDARKENSAKIEPAQGRGVYPVETRAQSQIKSRPETIININGCSPKDPPYVRPDNNDITTNDDPMSTNSESELENTLPI